MVFFGLAVGLALLAFLTFPVVSLWRTAVLQRQIAALDARLRALELTPGQLRPEPDPPPAPAASAAPSPSPAPVTADLHAPAPSGPAPVPTPQPPADLEAILGERWMLYAGLLVLLLGVAFFLKYAFEQAWVTPEARCAIGALAGLALVPSGLGFARRGYERYGLLISGAGIVILYLTTYAAMNLYSLIAPATGAGALILVTAAGALLADRRHSLPLALLAVLGGFATPLLVGGSRDAQLTLFSYVALLIAATISLARRRGWPQLTATSYLLTVVILLIWAGRFYSPDKHLRTELFLTLYCAMFVQALASLRRAEHAMVVPLLGTAPVLYYLASLNILWDFRLELFTYLILFSGAALAVSIRFVLDGVRLAAWGAAALPFLARLDHSGPSWTTAMVATAAGIAGMHLAAQVHRLGKGTRVAATDVLLLHGNGVFACAAAYMIFEHQWLAGAPWLAWALGAGYGALAWSIRRFNLEAALHYAVLAFALIAAGVALRFDGPWVIAVTAAEGAGVAWIGLRVARTWFRTVGLIVVAFASAQWLTLALSAPPASLPFLFNSRTATGAFIVALVYALAVWHRTNSRAGSRLFAPLIVAAQILTVAVLTAEASAFWEVRTLTQSYARVAAQLSISLLWAVYAAALVVVGLRQRFPPVRYVGMALFALTLGKVFLSDFTLLAGFYRVAGFLAVGAVLVLVSFLYQRVSARTHPAGPAASSFLRKFRARPDQPLP